MLLVDAEDDAGAARRCPFAQRKEPCADASAGPLPELTQEKLRLWVVDVQHHPRTATTRHPNRPHQIGGNIVYLHDTNPPLRAHLSHDAPDPEKELEIASAVAQQARPAVAAARPAHQRGPVQPAAACPP